MQKKYIKVKDEKGLGPKIIKCKKKKKRGLFDPNSSNPWILEILTPRSVHRFYGIIDSSEEFWGLRGPLNMHEDGFVVNPGEILHAKHKYNHISMGWERMMRKTDTVL